MANGTTGAPPADRVREIEMRLWEEVGSQLKGVSDAMKDMTLEMRDVRDRLIRMESQDQPAKIAKLEADLREASDEIAEVKQEATAFISLVKQAAHDEVTAAKQVATDEIKRVEKQAADDKLALEKRLTRMEIIIAPLTVGGSAFLAAVIGAIVTLISGGFTGH